MRTLKSKDTHTHKQLYGLFYRYRIEYIYSKIHVELFRMPVLSTAPGASRYGLFGVNHCRVAYCGTCSMHYAAVPVYPCSVE